MRPKPNQRIEIYRNNESPLGESMSGEDYGYFEVSCPTGLLRVISSGSGEEWEHVSVSLSHRTPTWEEMQLVKELFWSDEETVVQFHPKKSSYVNCHPHVLHLWKLSGHDAKLPDRSLIA